jgi:hypothetical protein
MCHQAAIKEPSICGEHGRFTLRGYWCASAPRQETLGTSYVSDTTSMCNCKSTLILVPCPRTHLNTNAKAGCFEQQQRRDSKVAEGE